MANLTWQSVTALVLTLIATIVGIVSMATDHWADTRKFENAITGMSEKLKGNRGLIQHCLGDICTKYEDDNFKTEDYIRGTLAAMCLAFLTNGGALVTLIIWILDISSDFILKIMKMATIFLLGFSIFWYIIALLIFAIKDEDSIYSGAYQDYTLSWSWGIVILAIVLDIFGIVMMVLATRKETYIAGSQGPSNT